MQFVNLCSKTDSSIYPPPSPIDHLGTQPTDRKSDGNNIVLSLLPPIQGDELPDEFPSSVHVYTTDCPGTISTTTTGKVPLPPNDSGNEHPTSENAPSTASYFSYHEYLMNDKPILPYYTGLPAIRSSSTLFVNPMLQRPQLANFALNNRIATVPAPVEFRQRYPLFVNPNIYQPIHYQPVESENIQPVVNPFHEVAHEPIWLEQTQNEAHSTEFVDSQINSSNEEKTPSLLKTEDAHTVSYKEKFENTVSRLKAFDHFFLIESIVAKGISSASAIYGTRANVNSEHEPQTKPNDQAAHQKCKLLIGLCIESDNKELWDILNMISKCSDTKLLEANQFVDLDPGIRAEMALVPGDYLVKLTKPGRIRFYRDNYREEYMHSFELHQSALVVMSTRDDIVPECCGQYLDEIDDEIEFWKRYYVYRGWYYDYRTKHPLKEELLFECYKFAAEMKVHSALNQFTATLIDRLNERNWLVIYGLAMSSSNHVLKVACAVYFLRTINCTRCTHILNFLLHSATVLFTNAESEFDTLINLLENLNLMLFPKVDVEESLSDVADRTQSTNGFFVS